MNKITLASLAAVLLLTGTSALADSATVYLYPSSSAYVSGTVFVSTLVVNPNGNQACVVKGTLALNNATCSSITVAPGLLPQTVPSCTSPNFTIGIPQCTTALKNILTVTAKAGGPGQAGIALADVKIIGAGSNVDATVQGSTYTVSAPVVTQVPSQPTATAPASSGQEVTKELAATIAAEATVGDETGENMQATASVAGGVGDLFNTPWGALIGLLIGILIGWGFSPQLNTLKNRLTN